MTINTRSGGRADVGWARVVGERDTWLEDMRRLLAGKPIRRLPPEARAFDLAQQALQQPEEAEIPPVSTSSARHPDGLNFAVSHDGAGRKRGVTAVAFGGVRRETSSAISARLKVSARHSRLLHRDADDRTFYRSRAVRGRYEPNVIVRAVRKMFSNWFHAG